MLGQNSQRDNQALPIRELRVIAWSPSIAPPPAWNHLIYLVFNYLTGGIFYPSSFPFIFQRLLLAPSSEPST